MGGRRMPCSQHASAWSRMRGRHALAALAHTYLAMTAQGSECGELDLVSSLSSHPTLLASISNADARFEAEPGPA
jgi:proteasome lid subunit RPN8/RPN11